MDELEEIIHRCQHESTFDFIRSTGPGGQKVNKVATAVQLRFNFRDSQVLPASARSRLIHLAGKRMTKDGVLIILAQRFRTQAQNREDASARFAALIKRAFEKPKPRRKTKPTSSSREKRLSSKRKRSDVKRTRQNGLIE